VLFRFVQDFGGRAFNLFGVVEEQMELDEFGPAAVQCKPREDRTRQPYSSQKLHRSCLSAASMRSRARLVLSSNGQSRLGVLKDGIKKHVIYSTLVNILLNLPRLFVNKDV
jgi:hypothetical protein